MKRILASLHHHLSLRLLGESRRSFAPLPALDDTTASPDRARRVLELRPDLRDLYPFAICPADRGRLLDWWSVERPFGVPPEDCLALLGEVDNRADRGLAYLFRLQPTWQAAVPDALTSAGWPKLRSYLIDRYRMPARWLKDAELPPDEAEAAVDRSRGVNVVAHLGYSSGLQQAAEGLLDALGLAGISVSLRSLPVTVQDSPPAGYLGLEPYDTTLYVAAVNSFPDEWYGRSGLWLRPGVRRIAVWYWETENLPTEWVPRLQWPAEVWTPTEFVRKAVAKVVRVPHRPLLPGVTLPEFPARPREHFGLSPNRFVFLFTFDMNSTLERKNPLDLIRAFRWAFCREEPVDLVVKVSRGESDPENFRRLQEACTDGGVVLLNQLLPREELLALFATCDCYVSLHRAEGFGLGLAEAMLLGKPVVATAYSGNLDFMTAESAYLVRADSVTTATAHGPYPAGTTWAAPDISHAAECLRRVYSDRVESARIAECGRQFAEEQLSRNAYARRVQAALAGQDAAE